MNFRLLIKSAFRSLAKHKTRSFLTTLGIIIGVVAIITVMSIGEGAKYKVKQEIERLGPNFLIVIATPPKSLMQSRGGSAYTLRPTDVQAVINECPDIKLVSPGVQYFGKAVHGGSNWQTQIFGTNELYPEIRQWDLLVGDYFTAQDVRSGTRVAVLGKTVARELFNTTNPIGTYIRIKKMPFKVIGVLTEKGRTPDGRDFDDAIFVPTKTALRKLLGKTNYSALIMSAVSKERMDQAAEQVRGVLRQKHRLQERDDDDFTLFTQSDIAKATDAASSVLNVLLLMIASISLIVGGIGIMNIMLVTVTERTKEIGVRMALGATTQTILTQFIIEAVFICLAGGLIGMVIAIIVAKGIGVALQWPIFISQSAVVISLCSSVLIGLFFGYYPAYKASQLNPVQALLDQ